MKAITSIDTLFYKDGKVWINKTQYFDSVTPAVWEFYIGGCQPAQKWLKNRKRCNLSFDGIQHYQKIVNALHITDTIQQHIDATADF